MIPELLDRIASIDFEAEVVASTPGALRLILRRRPEVPGLRRQYDQGTLSEEIVKTFVARLLKDDPGDGSFPCQVALATLAVVFEERFGRLPTEYLEDLARIRSPRFFMASGVARLCLRHRNRYDANYRRRFQLVTTPDGGGEVITFTGYATPLNRPHMCRPPGTPSITVHIRVA